MRVVTYHGIRPGVKEGMAHFLLPCKRSRGKLAAPVHDDHDNVARLLVLLDFAQNPPRRTVNKRRVLADNRAVADDDGLDTVQRRDIRRVLVKDRCTGAAKVCRRVPEPGLQVIVGVVVRQPDRFYGRRRKDRRASRIALEMPLLQRSLRGLRQRTLEVYDCQIVAPEPRLDLVKRIVFKAGAPVH